MSRWIECALLSIVRLYFAIVFLIVLAIVLALLRLVGIAYAAQHAKKPLRF